MYKTPIWLESMRVYTFNYAFLTNHLQLWLKVLSEAFLSDMFDAGYLGSKKGEREWGSVTEKKKKTDKKRAFMIVCQFHHA